MRVVPGDLRVLQRRCSLLEADDRLLVALWPWQCWTKLSWEKGGGGKTLVASFAALRYGYDAMALQLRVVSVECRLRRRAECVSVIYLVFDAG